MDDHIDFSENEAPPLVTLTVSTEESSLRLDRLISTRPDIGLSRTRVKRLIEDGHVMVNGVQTRDVSQKLAEGSELVLTIPNLEDAEPEPQAIPLSIVYEDEALIVINKPAGLIVHPGAGVKDGTLVNALLHHCGASLSGIGGVRRPGIVHRLDKATSGLLVVAKSDSAHKALSDQFADHGRTGVLERRYQALVWGVPSPIKGCIDTQIGRAPHNRLQMTVLRSGGRQAITHYKVVETFGVPSKPVASLVECRLETGRTHQVRVHLTHIGHPLIGDPDYGRGHKTKAKILNAEASTLATDLARQALHAFLLVFAHPVTGETMRFQSDLPEDMRTLYAALKRTEA